MPKRQTVFVNFEYYHIFNRGVNKMQIFNSQTEFKHFLKTTMYYQYANTMQRFSDFNPENNSRKLEHKQVEIVSYCLMPNHFHMLVQQLKDGGIQNFTGKLLNSYTRYHNIKNGRLGPLFQGRFKSVHVNKDEQLMHLIRYIHLNPVVSGITKTAEEYPWCSFTSLRAEDKEFKKQNKLILNYFGTINNYLNFVDNHIDYARKLDSIKHLVFE